MRLFRLCLPGGAVSLGVDADQGGIADLGPDPDGDRALSFLRRMRREGQAAVDALAAAAAHHPSAGTADALEGAFALLPPVPAPEVWAAGVTYLRSRDARDRESGGAARTPYDLVYDAERPELFFKATAGRLQGPGGPVGLRADSRWQVPEPELALVLDEDGAILGYTLGNDMSCRDIEGSNPLYLPQAKIYRCSCAIGPAVLPAPLLPAEGFPLECRVDRAGAVVWSGRTHTAEMRRSFAELVAYLGRHNWILPGTVLLTGTGLVPPDDFTLQPGDEVTVSCPAIGTLRNRAAWV